MLDDLGWNVDAAPTIAALDAALARTPDDWFLHVRRQDTLLAGDGTNEQVVAEYKRLRDDHPSSAMFATLYGRALPYPGEPAVAALRAAIALDDRFEPAHRELAQALDVDQVDEQRKQLDRALELCPNDLQVWDEIVGTADRDQASTLASKLRSAISSRSDANALAGYQNVWKLEIKALDTGRHDRLRTTLLADLSRMREHAGNDPSMSVMSALHHGYWLVGDEAGMAWVQATARSRHPTFRGLFERARFETRNERLRELGLVDLSGKRWQLADLEGKTVFVNVWASWCKPCMEELPLVARLYELIKTRSDIMLITLNADPEPGTAEAVVRKAGWRFPVLPAFGWLRASGDSVTLPQNWVVDAHGMLRRFDSGFGGAATWVDEVLETIETVILARR